MKERNDNIASMASESMIPPPNPPISENHVLPQKKKAAMFGPDRRIGIAGGIVGLIGIGVTIIFPDAKVLGWLCLFCGFLALAVWLIAEVWAETFSKWLRALGSIGIFSLFVVLLVFTWRKSHELHESVTLIPTPVPASQTNPVTLASITQASASHSTSTAEKPKPATSNSPTYLYDNVLMSVGPSVEPTYAFETRFIFSNKTLGRLSNAHYECTILNESTESLKLKHPITFNSLAESPLEDLPNNLDRSLYCDFVNDPIANQLESPILNIIVFYKVGGRNQKAGFRFAAKRRPDDKTYVWLPAGEPQIVTVPQK